MARRHSRTDVAIAGGAAILAALVLASCSPGTDGPTESPLVFVSHTPAAEPATSFTAGSYIVGQDIELGRYSAGADVSRCRWLQRDSSGKLLDRNSDARPTQVLTLSAPGSELVVAGAGCTFVRLP